MIENLKELLSEKDILLLGFGAEGRSTYSLLQQLKVHKSLGIADMSKTLVAPEGVALHLGEGYLDSLSNYDLIIKSPGIPLPKSLWEKHRSQLTSQIEIFLKYYKGRTIGLTGTKGKSSTCSMLYSMLSTLPKKVHFLGNIGLPVLSALERLSGDDIVLLELSSHQLHHIDSAPDIAILLNFYPEHLEYYGTLEEYRAAKFSILQKGSEPNVAFVNSELFQATEKFHSERNFIWVSPTECDFETPPHLSLTHQRINAHFAYEVASTFGITKSTAAQALKSCKIPPHRTEEVGVFNGIRFINDSAATIPEATIAALQGFPETKTLIVGGFDRGVDLGSLRSLLDQTLHLQIICIPETGKKLFESLRNAQPNSERLHMAKDLENAVQIAKHVTPTGATCLFSPSAASYHAYKNFSERGEHFRRLVSESKET
ncbi:MAG: UDP-N-acetylmuramoyl-L-alanine--D-glutamate ligase [Bdellovibrionales bacterium]|nr:UDP-N-acetylmuramoyl-L-alanine--D-glutamate ligase [Bdellovibrionales bacterium]